MVLVTPQQYQVFQRRSKDEGFMKISGRVETPCDELQIRVTGRSISGPLPGNWQGITLQSEQKDFNSELSVPSGGWYQVEVRVFREGHPIAEETVEKVGVGEVFVGAGQSNATNCGEEKTQQTSGMVSSFGGTDWCLADDPQPGVQDDSEGGSFWPTFGDALYARYQVPIGVAVTGFGGTSVKQWEPGKDLFNWMMKRIHALGEQGFRAVLWHQGESDFETPGEEYFQKLSEVIQASKEQAGWEFPWFVAQASYHNPEKTSFPQIRKAQAKLWEKGIALEGPDTDTLTGDHRDERGKGIHFSAKGLRIHGRMWAEKVSGYLDENL